MNVLFLSPGFPTEMNWFTEGLATVGARVVGVGEHPKEALHPRCQAALSNYLRVPSLFDEDAVIALVQAEIRAAGVRIDRVESLWEPLMVLAARLREALDVPGLSVARTLPFRDKELMKQVLDEAGIRTPRHARCLSADDCRQAAERIAYPLIVKPIAGAGSADTHRVDDAADLERVLTLTSHVRELSVEEYIGGEEYTFDTVCAEGEILYHNVSWYRPRPLIARTVQWISPQTAMLRDPSARYLRDGVAMGQAVLKALGFQTGFTHMEWFLKEDGEAVFGEIGARPPGARSVDVMNIASDIDLYRGWAHAACHGALGQEVERKYAASVVFKRAQGEGRIHEIEGLQSILARFGPHLAEIDLLPLGAHRRNWKQTLLSDGHLIVRHPDQQTCHEIADRVGTDLQMYAGLMSRVILLGPQRFQPITREAIDSLDLPEGPLALVTAGWEEREDEDGELVEHLGGQTVNLKLHARFERVLRSDVELQQALKDVHERLRSQQSLYRLRLSAALSSTRSLFAHEGPEDVLELEREDAVRALAALDAHHHARVQAIHGEFNAVWQLERHEELSRAREEVERDLEPCVALLIAGGHVVMLLDRLRAFGLRRRIGERPVVAWSAGAMAVSDQVVTFHDSPPQGRGDPEVLEDGLGLVPGLVALPDARRRLRLDDPVRVSLFARRFAPARCFALDPGSRVDWDGSELRPVGETRELTASGRVEAVNS